MSKRVKFVRAIPKTSVESDKTKYQVPNIGSPIKKATIQEEQPPKEIPKKKTIQKERPTKSVTREVRRSPTKSNTNKERPTKNKYYYTDKETKDFICLCHNRHFKTRDQVYKHCVDNRVETNTLTDYDKHFRKLCGRRSRGCRYCHPEVEISTIDVKAGVIHKGKGEDIHGTIITLLQLESRHRNKFSQEHLNQLEKVVKNDNLEKMIRERIEKRLRVKPEKDGYQTPYVKHAIDVAGHTTATCCRGCVHRWHGYSKTKDLSDQEVDYLVKLVYTYLIEYIYPEGEVRKWMIEQEPNEKGWYYTPGEYRVTIDSVELIREYTDDPSTHWYTFKHQQERKNGGPVDYVKLFTKDKKKEKEEEEEEEEEEGKEEEEE